MISNTAPSFIFKLFLYLAFPENNMHNQKLTMLNKQIGVRMPDRDIVLLREICMARGEDLSDFVRRAVRKEFARLSYLSDPEKKALGIKPEMEEIKGEG